MTSKEIKKFINDSLIESNKIKSKHKTDSKEFAFWQGYGNGLNNLFLDIQIKERTKQSNKK